MSPLTLPEKGISLISPLVSSSEKPSGERLVAPAVQQQWEQARTAVVQLNDLRDDWDGQGGLPPTSENIASVLRWIEGMRCWAQALPPSQVVSGVGGEVLLYWQQQGVLLEAEIRDPNTVDWLLAVEGQPTKQWQTKQDLPWLVATLVNGVEATQQRNGS